MRGGHGMMQRIVKTLAGLPYWMVNRAVRHGNPNVLSLVMFATMGMTMIIGGLALGPVGIGAGAAIVFAWAFFGHMTE